MRRRRRSRASARAAGAAGGGGGRRRPRPGTPTPSGRRRARPRRARLLFRGGPRARFVTTMAGYAIISLGGKQYRVREGERLLVDRLPYDGGKTFHPDVLLLGGGG